MDTLVPCELIGRTCVTGRLETCLLALPNPESVLVIVQMRARTLVVKLHRPLALLGLARVRQSRTTLRIGEVLASRWTNFLHVSATLGAFMKSVLVQALPICPFWRHIHLSRLKSINPRRLVSCVVAPVSLFATNTTLTPKPKATQASKHHQSLQHVIAAFLRVSRWSSFVLDSILDISHRQTALLILSKLSDWPVLVGMTTRVLFAIEGQRQCLARVNIAVISVICMLYARWLSHSAMTVA